MRSARVLTIGFVGLSLMAMGLADRFVHRSTTTSAVAASDLGTLDPWASAPDSGSSLWFCPSGESTDGAETIITIANPTGKAGTGTVSFLGNAGQRATANVQIGAYARVDVRAAESLAAAGVGAIVEVNAGGLAVEQKVVRGNQTYGAACATSTSTAWYFADGDTTLGASSVLSVLNPFGEDAVLDISFSTERGAARPSDLQGFLVPGSSMRRIDIGAYVRRRAQVSTVVKARVGRVAVDQTTSPDGVRFSMVNGAPALGSSWYFPSGRTNGVLRERYVLFNPTGNDVSAQIDVVVEGGEVEPFEIDVPARSRVDLVPNEESRIARDTDYSVVVATDSPSLVVQRTLRAAGIYRAGFATTLGSRRSASAWIVPDVVASATRDDTISILNPTDTPTAVSLSLNSGGPSGSSDPSGSSGVGDSVASAGPDPSLGVSVDGKAPVPLAGAENLLVKAASRVTVRLSDFAAVASGSLLVRSSAAEIVVERTATAVKRRGRRVDRPTYVLADAASLAASTDTSGTLPDVNSNVSSGSGAGQNDLPVDDTYGADDSSVVSVPAAGVDTSVAAVGPVNPNRTMRFGEFFVVVQAPTTVRSPSVSSSASTAPNSTARPPTTTIRVPTSAVSLGANTTAASTVTTVLGATSPSIALTTKAPVISPVPSRIATTTITASATNAVATTSTASTTNTASTTSTKSTTATNNTAASALITTPSAPTAPTTTVPTTTGPTTTGPTTTAPTATGPTTSTEKPAPAVPQMGLGPVAKAGASTFSAMAIPLRPTP
jgi:hypothetical protein